MDGREDDGGDDDDEELRVWPESCDGLFLNDWFWQEKNGGEASTPF